MENDENVDPNPAQTDFERREESVKPAKPISEEDVRVLLRIIVDLNGKAKRTTRPNTNVKAVYEAATQFERLYIDALLAKLVQDEKLFIEGDDQTIYLSF